MLAYLISRKHVTKRDYVFWYLDWCRWWLFDTAHFADSLKLYPFQGGVLFTFRNSEVDFHFPTITISKMAKMPFIADPRYAYDEEKRYDTYKRLREDEHDP